ncbi:MAG TPA: hypothetical protein DCS29_00755 [Candidatus Magasanikbacteria bacterium]|nr:MAG: hypothetical protein A2479_04490 [Candidatus Magasanikbacteria bacterium RIFOXYC2_FULL_39_8]HAT03295.1 hypothetical protein [Candidatus Magasanikbacteria bacterium]
MSIKLPYYVYFLQSIKHGSFYIGVTNNIERRIKEHNRGQSKSTVTKRPWELKKIEKFSSIEEAYQRERWLKRQKSRIIIEKIIEDKNNIGE